MRIVVTGNKSSGKSTIGALLANRLGIRFIDVDDTILKLWRKQGSPAKSCADIFRAVGEQEFRSLERAAVREIAEMGWCVVATGGSSLLDPESRRLLRQDSIWLYLNASAAFLWQRLVDKGLPSFLEGFSDPQLAFFNRVSLVHEVLLPRCDCHVHVEQKRPEKIVDEIVALLHDEFAVRVNSPDTMGSVIRLTTFGESHGPMIGAVLDGVPPGIPLEPDDIQRDLDRRKPGQSVVSTQRQESDKVEIVSGVFDGKTTGTPIGLLIRNADSRSAHYDTIKDMFRPGHADFTFWRKYGVRDYRGGGRSSGRETAARVAGGAVARKILHERGVAIHAYAVQIGTVRADAVNYEEIERNPVRCPDAAVALRMEEAIVDAKLHGNSVGGIVRADVCGLPAGLGDPVFAKLDARLAMALFSIGAVKGVEFGAGFRSAEMLGSENNDQMRDGEFLSNHAGGILGGISTGQPIVVRVAIKPTPSINISQSTCDIHGHNRDIKTEGRHDPCIVPRIIPVIESMIALTLLDAWEIQERLRPQCQCDTTQSKVNEEV